MKRLRDALIVPGMVDLHAHAPQYAFRGLGMDLELLEWLNTHTFPEEAKYAGEAYARQAYTMYVEELKKMMDSGRWSFSRQCMWRERRS